jgi:hypothetical protein
LSNKNISSVPEARWQHITALVANAGHVTVGHIAHIECAAIAADEHTVFATVVRRQGESFDELLQRLEQAIGRALNEGVFTNEVDGGHFELAAPKGRKSKAQRRD